IDGADLERKERVVQGRTLVLYQGPGTKAGGEIHLSLKGLPHESSLWRGLAAVATLLVLLGFGAYAASGDGGVSGERRATEQKREHMLDELVALEKKGDDDKRNKKREELKEKLAQLYRDLDQLS